MKSEQIIELFQKFEAAAVKQEDVEYWSARELYTLFGYTQWRNFLPSIEKAKESCEAAGEQVVDHFAHVRKMVDLAMKLLVSYRCHAADARDYECWSGVGMKGEIGKNKTRWFSLRQ